MKWLILILVFTGPAFAYDYDNIVDESVYTPDADKSKTIVEVETDDGLVWKVCCFTRAEMKDANKVTTKVLETINKEKSK